MASVSTRSGETFLTDDDLLLFDFIALYDVPFWAMCRDKYQLSINSRETHSLDDGALRDVLERYVGQGLLRAKEVQLGVRRGPQQYFGLTAAGGELWERERRPVWNLYCVDSYCEKGVDVECLSSAVAEAFVETGKVSGLLDPSVELVQSVRHEPAMHSKVSLIQWKTFSVGYELKFRAPEVRDFDVDWALYESRRTWWRSVEELVTLRRN